MRSWEHKRATAVALLLLVIGVLLGLLTVVILVLLPDQWADRAREPEDLYLSVFWALVCAWLGALAFRAGRRRWLQEK